MKVMGTKARKATSTSITQITQQHGYPLFSMNERMTPQTIRGYLSDTYGEIHRKEKNKKKKEEAGKKPKGVPNILPDYLPLVYTAMTEAGSDSQF